MYYATLAIAIIAVGLAIYNLRASSRNYREAQARVLKARKELQDLQGRRWSGVDAAQGLTEIVMRIHEQLGPAFRVTPATAEMADTLRDVKAIALKTIKKLSAVESDSRF